MREREEEDSDSHDRRKRKGKEVDGIWGKGRGDESDSRGGSSEVAVVGDSPTVSY